MVQPHEFFSASPFMRWTLVPVLVAFAVWLPLDMGEWTPVRVALAVVLSSTALLYAAALLWPRRCAWASRAVAGIVFLSYVGYAVHEWFFTSEPVRAFERRSQSSPGNALKGLLLIGVPALLYALHRRRRGASTERSLAELDQAVAIDPDDPWTRMERGRMRYDLADADGARADLAIAVAGVDARSDAAELLGYLELAEGDVARAAALFEALLTSDPDSISARLGLFAVAHARADWKEALDQAQLAGRGFEGRPSSCVLYEWLAETRAGRSERARRVLEDALQDLAGMRQAAWLVPFLEFLLGRRDEDAMLASWDDPHPVLLATADFWAGIRRELAGDASGARKRFQECVDAGAWESVEHACARARLRAAG